MSFVLKLAHQAYLKEEGKEILLHRDDVPKASSITFTCHCLLSFS